VSRRICTARLISSELSGSRGWLISVIRRA
jgi:hypothetical protein